MSSSYTPEEYNKALAAWETYSKRQKEEYIQRYINAERSAFICPICHEGFTPSTYHTNGVYCSYDCEKQSGAY